MNLNIYQSYIYICVCEYLHVFIYTHINILIYIQIYIHVLLQQFVLGAANVLGICRLPIHAQPPVYVPGWLLVACSESHPACQERPTHKGELFYAL